MNLITGQKAITWAAMAPVVIAFVVVGIILRPHSRADSSVPGESYMICDDSAQYLTSPWSYSALPSGSQSYTVAQYEALTGYGTTLPPLPSYVADESSSTEAAVIYAPGSVVSEPAYNLPETPIVQYFEGGAYTSLGLQTISGDEFIGGSAAGYPEPTFNDEDNPGGIDAGNDTYSYSGNSSTLAATAGIGTTSITLTSSVSSYAGNITFADGTTYGIAAASGTSVTLDSGLTTPEAQGSAEWTNSSDPIATLGATKAQGATTVTLSSSTIPLVKWGHIVIGTQDYEIGAVSGSQSGYTVTISGGLDVAANADTPIYYNDLAGGVTVDYLDIYNDLHNTTGTITLGSGWTLEHSKIHDSYRNEGEGVAFYGGDEATIEYNCFSKMGSSGAGGGGTGEIFDYNEVYQAGYEGDPGCGCTGDKWWGTLNADIVDNAFVEVGLGGGTPAIWLDNGNTGTNISGNYFYKNVGDAIESETGYNLNITNNLFEDDNWGTGSGCGDSNCAGDIGLNSSGGFSIPLSRYNNQINISGNQFINDWGGVTIWESGLRNCASSGEGWPVDAAYCTGGFPTTDTAAAGGQYYFSHQTDSGHGGTTTLDQTASAGSTTVMTKGPEAIDDQIGFSDPTSTTTNSTTDVTTLSGSQSINAASTSGFPSSGDLRVDTSAAGGGGGLTGAILSYTGTTGTSFTGVSLVRGTGTLTGTVLQVQPYKVTSETCYANDCALTVSPAVASTTAAGATVTSAGTCALFATSVATPTGPIAPDSISYYDGCQWRPKNIQITDNSFDIDPAYINSQTADNGGTTSCTTANQCGTNFMAFQDGGDPPYGTNIDGNAMMSNSSLTTCPSWDSGCTSDPLANLNALSNPPDAPANNNEAPSNNLWSDNTYDGPWTWNAYNYGPCDALPQDPTTNQSTPTSPSPCYNVDFAHWQADWQQDTSSTYSATPSPQASSSATPTPSASPSGKIGDLNNDGQVNIFDLSILLSAWGTNNATADLNHDGTVNIFDLSMLLSNWGT